LGPPFFLGRPFFWAPPFFWAATPLLAKKKRRNYRSRSRKSNSLIQKPMGLESKGSPFAASFFREKESPGLRGGGFVFIMPSPARNGPQQGSPFFSLGSNAGKIKPLLPKRRISHAHRLKNRGTQPPNHGKYGPFLTFVPSLPWVLPFGRNALCSGRARSQNPRLVLQVRKHRFVPFDTFFSPPSPVRFLGSRPDLRLFRIRAALSPRFFLTSKANFLRKRGTRFPKRPLPRKILGNRNLPVKNPVKPIWFFTKLF